MKGICLRLLNVGRNSVDDERCGPEDPADPEKS